MASKPSLLRILSRSFPLLLVAGLPLVSSVYGQENEFGPRVDAIFRDFDSPTSPGCALGVVQHGSLVHERGYGSANLDHGIPLTSSSAFYIASVSKQFAAGVMALMADQGHISLDDDVRLYVPELPDYGTPITIRHMVHHTSGMRDYLGLMNLAGMRVEDVHSDQDVLNLIVRQRSLNFTPGDEYLYSNSGYFLMSVIVDRVTGKSLRDYADTYIFGPLGMRNTHFHDDRTMIVPNRAMAYSPVDSNGFRVNYWANFEKVGSGGLVSTVHDLHLWEQNFQNDRLGSPSFMEEMHSRGVLNSGDTLQYAFGINMGEYRGLRTVSHGGSSMGFRAHFLRFPDQEFAVITLCNVSTAVPGILSQQVADIYLEDHFAEGTEPAQPTASPREDVVVVPMDLSELASLAGAYHSPELLVDYMVEVEEGALWLRRPGAPNIRMLPTGDDLFMSGAHEIRFFRDHRGRPAGFDLHAGRVRSIHFHRR